MGQLDFEFEQVEPLVKSLQTTEERGERVLNYRNYLQKQKDKFDEKKRLGKETYFLGGDSMKCLICNRTIFSSVSIKARYCVSCDIFHDPEDDPQAIFKKSI